MQDIIIKLKNYNKELDAVNEELHELPTGRLARRGGLYGHAFNKTEVAITNNAELIYELCRKKYLLIHKKQLNNDISIFDQYINKFESKLQVSVPREIIQSLSPAYQEVPDSYFYHPAAIKWLAEPYDVNPFPLGKTNFTSEKGTKVRSKSEFTIVGVLESYNIPYRYECALTLDGQTKYPDLIIINPYNGKIIIWEHFGMLDQPGYVKNMNDKMKLYINNGYIPFETLIYTFEFDVMNLRYLKNIVENVILKP